MLDLPNFIQGIGYIGLFIIVFSESGLFVGFFLPGDSLLFTAGLLASQGFLKIWPLIAVIFLGAVLGDNFGYAFGKKVGPAIFRRENSLLFNKIYLERTRAFYQKHGPKTVMLARFIPFARTFAPILAGVGLMNYRAFLTYNVAGGALWAVGLTWLGYFSGNYIRNIDVYILPIIGVIILLSLIPILKNKIVREKLFRAFKRKTPGLDL